MIPSRHRPCLQLIADTHRLSRESRRVQSVRVRAACRVDLAGGWSDTPPLTFEFACTAVVNVATRVDNEVGHEGKSQVAISQLRMQKPLCCVCRKLYDEVGIVVIGDFGRVSFSTIEEIKSTTDKPSLPGFRLAAYLVTALQARWYAQPCSHRAFCLCKGPIISWSIAFAATSTTMCRDWKSSASRGCHTVPDSARAAFSRARFSMRCGHSVGVVSLKTRSFTW